MDNKGNADQRTSNQKGACTVMGSLSITGFFCILVASAVLLSGCTGITLPTPTVSDIPSSHAGAQSVGTHNWGCISASCNSTISGKYTESPDFASHFIATELLTRPTDHSITVSVVAKEDLAIFFLYGTAPGSYSSRTSVIPARAGSPTNGTIAGLLPDTRYYYRTCFGESGDGSPVCGSEHEFQTGRSAGSTFTFSIQADSHPERVNKMFSPALYEQTMRNVENDQPDFFITLGDDFSIDTLIEKDQLSEETVDTVYRSQRAYLGIPGSSSPVFLVNGNHEQAARYLLDGTPDNAAVYAGTARVQYFPQPVPDGFYSGDSEPVEHVGLPGDYYAWTWGDALFVVIDPYWHSMVAVDNVPGKNEHQKKDMWDITLGTTQYQWFKRTLEQSNATYKFVFAHHVSGTGRGGIESAGLYEWGGRNQRGVWEFDTRRPGWNAPLQQLMADNGVTIFFQGHDHLFARQELDGVIYQEVPCPADPTYSTFNADAYRSGTILPNSGYLRVTISPQNATVEYVKSYLPGMATGTEKNGMVAYSYTVAGNRPAGGQA